MAEIVGRSAETSDVERPRDLYALGDGSVVLDREGAAWQLEKWDSFLEGRMVRERWWFTVGVKTGMSDSELLQLGPLRLVYRGGVRRSA
jgi:hypothetical protein